MIRPGKVNVVGPGVVCDPEMLVAELAIAQRYGSTVWLDERAPIVLPVHRQIDAGRESSSGASKIGTTGRGIGPCYESWTARAGLRLGDLRSEALIRDALGARGFYEERMVVAAHHGHRAASLEETVAWAGSFAERLVPHLADTLELIHTARAQGTSLLCEGAQGVMLDLMHGSWPFCTSSFCGAGAVNATLGLHDIDRVVGVAKAYVTRVGAGPFPTELLGADGERLRGRGGEYGATTGRPRRCGWLDLAALKYAVRVGGITELVVTKLDILSGESSIPVCTGYRDAKTNESIGPLTSLTAERLATVVPEWKECAGWSADLADCRRIEDLPKQALEYLDFIETSVGVPITGIGVSPERDGMIWVG